MKILDAHVHFWDPALLHYPWLNSVPALNRSFLPADFTAAINPTEVVSLVFVECGRDPGQNLDEVRWVTELAARDPRIQGIVAHANVERGAAIETDLAVLAANPLVKGVRRLLQDAADDAFCLRPAFVEGVQALSRFGFSFDLCIYHRQLSAVIELVKCCPAVSFVLNHVGKPAIRDGQIEPWRRQIEALASLPNVCCKVSGLVTEADHTHWRPEQLRSYLDVVFAAFGFDRLMFGSDWPVATLATQYPRWVDTVLWAVQHATDTQRQQLFRKTAERFYRLTCPPGSC